MTWNITLRMRRWREVSDFLSQKFRLTGALRKPQLQTHSSRFSVLDGQATTVHILFYSDTVAASTHSSRFSSFAALPTKKQRDVEYLTIAHSVCTQQLVEIRREFRVWFSGATFSSLLLTYVTIIYLSVLQTIFSKS